jgi:hypothetical protein
LPSDIQERFSFWSGCPVSPEEPANAVLSMLTSPAGPSARARRTLRYPPTVRRASNTRLRTVHRRTVAGLRTNENYFNDPPRSAVNSGIGGRRPQLWTRESCMSQSRYTNTRFSGRQDTYYAKVCTVAKALTGGDSEVLCPRDGCEQHIRAAMDGAALILRCPDCGVIFRGNKRRILETI